VFIGVHSWLNLRVGAGPKKNLKKSLAMPMGIDTNGVILQFLGGKMRTFKTCRRRGLPFRLFIVLAGALLLTAALVPRANAQGTIVYFNFEDGTVGNVDTLSDAIPPLGDNPGGGIQIQTLTIAGAHETNAPGASLLGVNRTALDIDLPGVTPQLALNLNHTSGNPGATLSFHANTTNLFNLSLSFGINNQGNGYNTVAFSYIIGGVTTPVGSVPSIGTVITTITFSSSVFPVLAGAANQPDVTFVLTFNNGNSNGNNLETVIDNIQLTATPEPATVVGGLLGVLGLCWFQRRRLIGCVRFRRT
jgi:hypothetical protein